MTEATVTKLSARASYAYSLYMQTLDAIGPRAAYQAAVAIAGLSAADRAAFRTAVMMTPSADITHWVRSIPISKPAEERGFACGAAFDHYAATSYRDQVSCQECLRARRRRS